MIYKEARKPGKEVDWLARFFPHSWFPGFLIKNSLHSQFDSNSHPKGVGISVIRCRHQATAKSVSFSHFVEGGNDARPKVRYRRCVHGTACGAPTVKSISSQGNQRLAGRLSGATPPESTRQLRRLVRHRAQLVRRRRDVKLRIRALLRENRLRCVCQRLAEGLAGLAQGGGPAVGQRPLDRRRSSGGTGLADAADRASRNPVEKPDSRRSDHGQTAGPARRRPDYGRDDAGRDRPLRSLQHGQATGAVLRRHSAQRLQRRAAGRRGIDQGRQSRSADGADRTGPSLDRRIQGTGPSWRTTCSSAANPKMWWWPRWPIAGCDGCITSCGESRNNPRPRRR